MPIIATTPLLQASHISHHFDNGETLFRDITCAITKQRIGLIGRNGAGKSVLASLFSGEQIPSAGKIHRPKSIALYRQQLDTPLPDELSIADYLGLSNVLNALKQISAGDCSSHWFDLVGEQWDLPSKLAEQLKEINLPANPDFPCAKLSGGQFARLQLWQLFKSDVELLILDEPSNHLDSNAKLWLLNAMQAFCGTILLISHDRQLLRTMQEIWELSSLGLTVYGGNYDNYAQQKQTEQQAITRQINSVEKQKKHLEIQAQRNRQKSEQRAAQGNVLRRSKSQCTMVLDHKKNSASASASSRNKNEQLRQANLTQKSTQLKARKAVVQSQKFYFEDKVIRNNTAVSVIAGILPYGQQQPINLSVNNKEKIHLMGKNGEGKSTLLKTLLGKFLLQSGELQVNVSLHYLDQHFSAIHHEFPILNQLMNACPHLSESDARTLLAGIGFRRDSVFRLGGMLSGGEKMKLAMLMASHQQSQPMLLLDEPDNHLDLESKAILSQALQAYRGGFIVVSHDDDFVKEAGVTRQFDLSTASKFN